MKTHLNRLFFQFVVLLMIVPGAGCKKGDTGPAGPQGPTGNTDMFTSSWLDVTMSGSSGNWYVEIGAPEITQDILDKGLIKVYLKSNTIYYELPNSTNLPGLGISFTVGKIAVFAPTRWDSTGGYKYRYVVIP